MDLLGIAHARLSRSPAQERRRVKMMATEQFKVAWDQTLEWLKGCDRSAWEGYEVAQLLQRAGVKYNWRLIAQSIDTNEREWREAQQAWLDKLLALGCPESLSAAVRAIE
ncbi:hypothetical protein DS837_29420 [Azospirillum brasilense]|uniref:Uncharacterized protein n=2 Tax=Azospirillum brasilense TaxID=192 RepID=A0A6L3ARP3_AZOBR|nr:hypothetical protein DS837_29420 [Azospirillum brasilense]